MNNKGRRNELKMLHYKKRKAKQFRGVHIADEYLYALRSHGHPCSCWGCSPDDKKYNRAKIKSEYIKQCLASIQ